MDQINYASVFINKFICWFLELRNMNFYDFKPDVTWDTWVQFILLLSGILVVWRQFVEQRKQQLKQHKDTIQYNVYEKIVDNYENSQPTSISTTLNLIMGEFDKSIERANGGNPYTPPPFYLYDLHNEFMEVHGNLLRIMATMDKYQIVSPYMSLFRKVIDHKVTELGNCFVNLIFVFAYILLQNKEAKEPIHIPSKDIIEKVKNKVAQFENIAWDISYYLDDILTESQNNLLGEFFKNKLPVRKPLDPELLVLTSTDQIMIDKIKEFLDTIK